MDQKSFELVEEEETIDLPRLSFPVLSPAGCSVADHTSYNGSENQSGKVISGSIRLSGMERKERREILHFPRDSGKCPWTVNPGDCLDV